MDLLPVAISVHAFNSYRAVIRLLGKLQEPIDELIPLRMNVRLSALFRQSFFFLYGNSYTLLEFCTTSTHEVHFRQRN